MIASDSDMFVSQYANTQWPVLAISQFRTVGLFVHDVDSLEQFSPLKITYGHKTKKQMKE